MENCLIVRKSGGVSKLQVASFATGKGTFSDTPTKDYYLIASLNAQLEYWGASGLERLHSHNVATGGGGAGTIVVVYKATKGNKWTISSNYTGLVVSKIELK